MAQEWKPILKQTSETMYCSHLEPSEINFLHQIKKELSLATYQEVVKRVTTVLHAFRQTLSPQSATVLLNSLPDFLKLAFVTNWKRSDNYKSVEHLDELVTLVMNRDKKNHQAIFKSEVQTLSVIILTLKKLLKLSGLENFEGISPTLRHELDEVPVEAATV
jgi:uncharacterized protein (DUF2267 family)